MPGTALSGVAISKFGWLGGTILVIISMTMNAHLAMLVWKVRMDYPNARTFPGLVELVFASAPEGQRSIAVNITGFVQYSFIFFMLSSVILGGSSYTANSAPHPIRGHENQQKQRAIKNRYRKTKKAVFSFFLPRLRTPTKSKEKQAKIEEN